MALNSRYPKAMQLPFIMVELKAAGHFFEATEERMLGRKMASLSIGMRTQN